MSDYTRSAACALADNLEDAIERLEECYDELKRHQSPRTSYSFLSDLNEYRKCLRENDCRG